MDQVLLRCCPENGFEKPEKMIFGQAGISGGGRNGRFQLKTLVEEFFAKASFAVQLLAGLLPGGGWSVPQ